MFLKDEQVSTKEFKAKKYALVINDELALNLGMQQELHKRLAFQKMQFDPYEPDYLINVIHVKGELQLQSTEYYKTGENKYSYKRKIKTNQSNYFFQVIDAKSYNTVWRGVFSSDKTLNTVGLGSMIYAAFR